MAGEEASTGSGQALQSTSIECLCHKKYECAGEGACGPQAFAQAGVPVPHNEFESGCFGRVFEFWGCDPLLILG